MGTPTGSSLGTLLLGIVHFDEGRGGSLHLIREKCSAGISFGAYAIWVVAAVLLLTYAILTRDPVFMALQSYQVLATGLVCFYSKRFEHNLCEIHGGSAQVEASA